MSKVIVYILDKFVWILLVAAITTQALQYAGVVEGPKTLGQISYPQDNNYEFKITTGDSREKRQAEDRSPLLDNIFNIPISTLNSINELLQTTRRMRLNYFAANQARAPRRTAKRPDRSYFDGPKVQADGSSSRVLLNI